MEGPPATARQRRASQPTYGSVSSEYTNGRQRRRSAAAPLRRRTTVRRPRPKASSSSSSSTPEQEEILEEHDFTLKDKQDAMNREHPFGLPIWKPALYRKSRSVVRRANLALHSSPSSRWFLSTGNVLWTLLFGWWLAIVMGILSIIISIMPPDGGKYSKMLAGLAAYLLWPFGRYVERVVEDYHRLPSSAEEETGLLRATKKGRTWKTTLVHIATSGPTGYLYYLCYFTIIAPLLFLVATICWMCVITIPMAKLTFQLLRHLRQRPLSLRFPSPTSSSATSNRAILLCTYEAVGLQYYKYTYEGINIIFINFLSLVFFVILDNYFLKRIWPDSFLASPVFLFTLSLGSVIPLSYFIGMAVSSVSAQTSMAVGSVINATFGSIIEIILYAIALMSGKGPLVEGSIIGSILVGVLLLPGSAMVSGGMKRKEQKFNSKSAGVTSTMLIMAIIAAMSPTFFYQMFASFELQCRQCPDDGESLDFSCSECHYTQMDPARDPVYQDNVKPFTWICAVILPSAYVIGMLFSLHTHVDMVWKSPASEQRRRQDKKKTYYQKLIQSYFAPVQNQSEQQEEDGPSSYNRSKSDPSINTNLNASSKHHGDNGNTPPLPMPADFFDDDEVEEEEEEMAGHDAPEWGTVKSFVILFACTVLYSIIAEILVDEVDVIMKDIALDEKFLGLTLFALVPNITEFTNAIGFSIHGNIVLSLEIGSAYALQVCLLQIPAMVAFSLWHNWGHQELSSSTFRLIFPTWDMIAVIFAVFLLTYTYQEGKSNYFKGAILILSYLVLVAGFYFIPSPAAAAEAQHSFLLGTTRRPFI